MKDEASPRQSPSYKWKQESLETERGGFGLRVIVYH